MITEEGKGHSLCQLSHGLSSKALMSLDGLLLLERWAVGVGWRRGPESTGTTPQGSAGGGQAGGEHPSCDSMACPRLYAAVTAARWQDRMTTSAAKNLERI